MVSSDDKILIDGIEFLGHCGVPKTERDALQRFSVSIELGLDLKPAAVSGNLTKTVDYEAVADLVASIGMNQSFTLLETMAEEMASGILKQFAVNCVKIIVKKKVPPVEAIRGFFAIELVRMKS